MNGTRMAAVALACAAIAGCGGGGNGDYAQAYNDVTEKVQKEMAALNAAPTGDPAKLGAQLTGLADALGEAAGDFAAIEPPDDARSGHEKVQSGVETLAADIRKSAEALGDGSSPAGAIEALGQIANSKGAAQIEAGQRELEQAGYKVQ